MRLSKGLMLTALVVTMAGCETVNAIHRDIKQQVKQIVNDVPKGIVHADTKKQSLSNGHKGLYHDTDTGLMWYVCPAGMDWKFDYFHETYACQPNQVRLDAKDTKTYLAQFINGQNFAGYSDWRLPTVFELEQLRANNCGEWGRDWTGTVLTANGREDTYKTATRRILDNTGNEIIINACESIDYSKLTHEMKSSSDVYIKAKYFSSGGLFALDNYYDKKFRVSTGITATNKHSYRDASGRGMFDLRFSEEKLDDSEERYFYIVRQATAPKSAQGANP